MGPGRPVLVRTLMAMLLGATPAMAGPDPTQADVEAMAGLFDAVCLRSFPNDASTDKVMANNGASPLTQSEVHAILHEDPGRGWRLQRPEATYLVTIEAPPWHACAVRRMTRAGMPTLTPYADATARYAAARQRQLTPVVRQSMHTESGLDIEATVQQVPGQAVGGITDSLMLLQTDYHGRYSGPLAADAGVPGIEVRFVHQQRRVGASP